MIYYLLFNNNLTARDAVLYFLISIFVYFVSLSLHEFAHAFVAVKMGDPTPKQAGRLTLNPFKHLDIMGFLCFMLVGFSWAKPVPVNPLNFKKYRKGMRAVSIAGITVNALLGLIAAGIYAVMLATLTFTSPAIHIIFVILEYFMVVNSFLAMFNLLPIYPMDGFNLVTTFMKTENKFIKFSLRNGLKIMLTLILISFATDLLFGFDLLDWYLTVLFNYVFKPIALLGVM